MSLASNSRNLIDIFQQSCVDDNLSGTLPRRHVTARSARLRQRKFSTPPPPQPYHKSTVKSVDWEGGRRGKVGILHTTEQFSIRENQIAGKLCAFTIFTSNTEKGSRKMTEGETKELKTS